MGSRTESLDWNEYIREDDLKPYLSDLPPTEAGRALHSYLETQVEVPGTDWEGDVFQGDKLVGRYDCYDELDGVVYEFKTKNETGMRRAPYPEDIKQIEGYLNALNEDIGFLIYIDRDTLEVQDYPVLN